MQKPALFSLQLSSPIGPINLEATEEALTGVFIRHPAEARQRKITHQPNDLLREATKQIKEYFSGTRTQFHLPLSPEGTNFQQCVWRATNLIQFGQTETYKSVAAHLGKPNASRAVGTALGANPLALIIPCHRVVSSQNKLSGYSAGAGIFTKRWLLEHEGIFFKNN